MARQRRGGGFRPPELRGTLGTLLRTTLAQAGTLRDVLERGAREGRSRLDSALSTRRRTDALADLGEIVLDLIRRGEIDLDELPEARDIVAHLDEIDAGHGNEHDEAIPAAPARNRFDARRRDASRAAPTSTRSRDADDGTVSSKTWSRSRGAPKPQAPRVWRPPVDDNADEPGRPDDEITARDRPAARPRSGEPTQPGRTRRPAAAAPVSPDDQPTAPSRPGKRKDPARKGGIHFDDDEDLAEYMHPDDVPPKGTPDGDS
ncbi:MAG TPA: hypothetical protein VIV11_08940 [Kofleriaceae bacterium]